MDTKHPLIDTRLMKIGDWKNWKRLWDDAPFLEQRLGLLHVAFDVEAHSEDWGDRQRFLIRLADGHAAAEYQWEADIRRHVPEAADVMGRHLRESAQAMQAVAAKAYKVLCEKFFGRAGFLRDQVDPVDLVGDADTFMTVMWFFCDHDRRRYGRNLPGDDKRHQDAVVRKYAHDLVTQGWSLEKWWEPGTQAYAETRRQFVRLLYELEELHFLYTDIHRDDEISLEELRRLALEEDGKPKYRTAGEAVGTYAGRVLLIVEAAIAESDRKAKIADAERKRREADQELAEAQKS